VAHRRQGISSGFGALRTLDQTIIRWRIRAILLSFLFEHDLLRKPESTFRDHARASFVVAFSDGKPDSTFPENALACSAATSAARRRQR
jgi:hypothetical protein